MLQDLKFAIRSLRRSPMFAFGAIATLALGIGVNATIFSLASSALFRPLPGIAAPDRIVWISSLWREQGRQSGLSYPDYEDYRAAAGDVFADMFAFRTVPISLVSGGDPQRIRGQVVSGSFFPALGVTPATGRLIGPSDDVRGSSQRVVTISHKLWRQRFGGTTDVMRTSILINGREFSVVGVAAEGFQGPAIGEAADVWVPFALWSELRASEPDQLRSRASSWLSVMGRLRPGVSPERAQAALASIAARLEAAYPDANKNRGVVVSGAGSPVPRALPARRASRVDPMAALRTE